MTDEPAADEFSTIDQDSEYVCSACGELIVVPVDRSAGDHQVYVEDCPVCCRPNRLTVVWHSSGEVTIMSEPE